MAIADGKRHIVVHYHIFKNAGTSLDQMLKRSFPGRWGEVEAEAGEGPLTTEKLASFIHRNPQLVAVSSHTALLPPPGEPGLEVFPLVLLRNPIDRVRSAYEFERKQNAETSGSKMARSTRFAGYVDHFLDLRGDRRFRNFQQSRLCRVLPAAEGLTELDRALEALETLPWIGVVEDFDRSMEWLLQLTQATWPEFSASEVRANATAPADSSLKSRLAAVRGELGSDLYSRLMEANLGDWILWERAWRRLLTLFEPVRRSE